MTSPYVNVCGSFFPIWLLCILGGIVITIAAKYFLARLEMDTEIGAPLLVYPSLAALCACGIWLTLFRP